MLALRASRLLRAAGYVLLLCVGFLAAETVVADICDGDGRVGAATSHLESSGAAAGDHAVHLVARDAGTSESEGGGSPVEHSAHVDHCSHPHAGGVIASAAASPIRGPLPARVAADSDREPPSASPEPVVRPPVA